MNSISFVYLVGGAIIMLKNVSQWEGLSHILWKIKQMKPPTSINSISFVYPIVDHCCLFAK
jgi:hypothetical protein